MKQNHLLHITNTGKQAYNKSHSQSLSKVTIVVASLIKSSTTLSRTRSTSELRKSSETKLGEALEHDDWEKYKVLNYFPSHSNSTRKKRTKTNYLRNFVEVNNSRQTRFLVLSNKIFRFKIYKQHISSAKRTKMTKKQSIIT